MNPYKLQPNDISVQLLAALATLPPGEREAWVDTYLVGRADRTKHMGTAAANANRKLRAHFGCQHALAEAV